MFDWLRPRPAAPTRLERLLAAYPACTPPHIGQNGAAPIAGQPILTLAQCRENLDAYRRAIPERLALLGGVLGELDLDIAHAYSQPDQFVARLHPTLLTELRSSYRSDLASRAAREVSTRSGPDIVLSFMADLAMLESDILVRAKPGCFVGLNLDPRDRTMLMWRRPCILGLVDRLFPETDDIHCPEHDWFGIYANMDHPGRLAAPDRVMPETWGMVIGGTILQRLDRNAVDPELAERLRTTWLGKAA